MNVSGRLNMSNRAKMYNILITSIRIGHIYIGALLAIYTFKL